MDALGYRLLPKTPELVSARRVALDQYANVSQASQVLVFVGIPFCRFIFSIVLETLRRGGDVQTRCAAFLARSARILEFRLKSELIAGYGTYGEWIFGLSWTTWLGFLCLHGTGSGT